MVLPKTHLEFDIRNNFPFYSFLNRARKPFSNTIWVFKWSHLISGSFYEVWHCSAPLYAWQLQACICATATECCSLGWFVGFIWALFLAQTLRNYHYVIFHPHFIICLPPTNPFSCKPSLTKQALAHQTPAWSADPPAQRHHLHIDHPASSFFSLMDLWVSSKGRALLDAWCLGRKCITFTKAGWGKKRGKKEYPSFRNNMQQCAGSPLADFPALQWLKIKLRTFSLQVCQKPSLAAEVTKHLGKI